MKKIFILLFIILLCIIIISLVSNIQPKEIQSKEVTVKPVQFQMPPRITYSQYSQIGFLTPVSNEKNQILPLIGRRVNRDRWNYYTISNQHNNIRLPITLNGKNTLSDQGVKELDNYDIVLVEGYNTNFKVKLYDGSSFNTF